MSKPKITAKPAADTQSLCDACCTIANACQGHPELEDIWNEACKIRSGLKCPSPCPACTKFDPGDKKS